MANDRTRAQIYLALTEGNHLDCTEPARRLDDEDLAALVDGTLTDDKHGAVMRHLAACSHCCNRYADVNEAVALFEPRAAAPQAKGFRFLPPIARDAKPLSWLGLGVGGVLAAWAYFALLAPTGVVLPSDIQRDLDTLANATLASSDDTLARGDAGGDSPPVDLEPLSDTTLAFVQLGLDAGYAIALPAQAWQPDSADQDCVQAGSVASCGAAETQAYSVGLWLALTEAWCVSTGSPEILERQTVRLAQLRATAEGTLLNAVDTSNAQTLCASARRLAAAAKAFDNE